MTTPHNHITIPSKTEKLAFVRKNVAEWAREAGFDGKAVHALQLAVDETCANAIEHGYGGKNVGQIDVEARITSDAIEIVIRHHGRSFNPRLHTLAALSDMRKERRPRGYGLHLITELVDDVSFSSSGRTNEVVLTKLR